MVRPRNAYPNRILNVALPGDVGAKLDLHLYSEAEQRTPHGAHRNFLTERIMEFFNHERFDLSSILPELPAGSLISGSPATIEALKRKLNVQS